MKPLLQIVHWNSFTWNIIIIRILLLHCHYHHALEPLHLVALLIGHVQPLVLAEERLVGKRLSTNVASVRLLPRVGPDVGLEALLALETFATVGALVQPLPSVGDHVLLQTAPVWKSGSALVTVERFDPEMNRVYVVCQPRGLVTGVVTLGAGE